MAAVQHRASAVRLSAVRRSALLLLLSGLTFSAAAATSALAQVPSPVGVTSSHPHAAHIAEASRRFGIPAAWIVAVMRAESADDVRAVSSAGAMGLMQVMPHTWAELRARYDFGRNPFDPRDNILAGTAYLREMWDRYGDVAAMLAAYNAGPARYDEHRATGRSLPAETRAYIASLSSALRGERPSESRSAVPRPLDWREAGIFIGRADGASTADLVSPDRSSDDARSSVPATPETPTALRSEGLFVARNAGGDRP